MFVTGCASIELTGNVSSPDKPQSRLSMYVGARDGYFLSLKNGEYKEIEIDSGSHDVFAKGRSGEPSQSVSVTLAPGERACLLGKPVGSGAVAGALVPIVGLAAPKFRIEQVDCPSDTQLESLSKID